jgi:Fibronectin type III domain
MTDRLSRLRCRDIITPVMTALILAGCAASGVLDVSWVAPTTNADGSPATNVVSYRVYYSTADPPCPQGSVVALAAPQVPLPSDRPLGFRLTGLTVGKLYFVAVTAVNSGGSESSCTSTVSGRARQP